MIRSLISTVWSLRRTRDAAAWLTLAMCVGCGTTKSYTATEQLLMSDAVDSAVSKIDFRPLAGNRIYLDTSYLASARSVPGMPNPMLGPQNLISADYVVSSIRQQMIAAGCFIEDKKEDAELVAEVRIGALGTDGHSVTYGIPANNALNSASSFVNGVSPFPTIPEISIAKRELKSGAAKVAVFAFRRDTHEAVWQSGIEQSNSNARDTWVLGVGPIQQGTIYKAPRFAGRRLYQGTAEDTISEDAQTGIPLRERHLFAEALGEMGAVEVPVTTASAAAPANGTATPAASTAGPAILPASPPSGPPKPPPN
jgi:hypothetical protein